MTSSSPLFSCDVRRQWMRRGSNDGGRGEDATARTQRRRGRSNDEDTTVTEGGDRGHICALLGWRADLGAWRGGGQICAYGGAEGRSVTSGEPTEDGGFVEGGRVEEVSDGDEEGGDDGG
ncbi:hypothetical protein LR48_Vigan08g098000 [Vigna angularis]|uniref:Uncharacterized protein n=1 Tax=Phaseolus angularis TaxID=3914 RepID=A0A0L9V5B9_PHAAN|nr:hypothetical protein LR48_Vigan08g098000 [Vigna angularis]